MDRKTVIFIADSLDNARRYKAVLAKYDVEVIGGSTAQLRRTLQMHPDYDLVIYEAGNNEGEKISQVEGVMAEAGTGSLLVIVNEESLANFRLPVRVKSDFVVESASENECAARIRQLLWPGNESDTSEYISVDNMTINLATYQVKVNGEPLDFTYLEYALLAFLVTHPGRTYSRDALLRRVWGFDYYGGSRTVDVHVRRVRAKLGPELAQRLETIRGVGYLWNS